MFSDSPLHHPSSSSLSSSTSYSSFSSAFSSSSSSSNLQQLAYSLPPRPTLHAVLANHSAAPWTLHAFRAFLARKHCTEVLAFTTAVQSYRRVYLAGCMRGDMAHTAASLWRHIVDLYVVPDAPCEINVPQEVRESLLAHGDPETPPCPEVLMAAYELMLDLMGGVFIQFLETAGDEGGVHLSRTSSAINISNYSNTTSSPYAIAQISAHTRSDPSTPSSSPPSTGYRRANDFWGSSRIYRSIRSRRQQASGGSRSSTKSRRSPERQ